MDEARHAGIGRWFALAARVEAATWLGLLVGMVLKYGTDTTEFGVQVFGRLHGAAFVAYVVVALVAARRLAWSWKVAAVALLASIPPLATLAFEVGAGRRGLLDEGRGPGAGAVADDAG